MKPFRFVCPALAATLLAACADPAALPPQGGPLTQQDVTETVTDLSTALEARLGRAAQDEGLIALQGLPRNSALTNPFFGYTVSLMRAAHPERVPRPLRARAARELPRGVYTYREGEGAEGWVLEGESDDLVLNWRYDADPATPEVETAEASATFGWNAQRPTLTVETPTGETLEVPSGMTFSMTADGERVAEVNLSATYYRTPGCGDAVDGVLDLTSLTVDGSGSLLTLDNVGFTVSEDEDGLSTVSVQGRTGLTEDTAALSWSHTVRGELTREACYTSRFSPEEGAVSVSLTGLQGETRSASLGFAFSDVDPEGKTVAQIREGALVVNEDENRTVTFEGPLGDENSDGVPGDDLTVRFPDGGSTTLEAILRSLGR